MNTKLQVSAIMLGVQDVARAKKFYVEGLGSEVEQDYPGFVRCGLGEGSSSLARGYYGYFSDPDDYLWKVTTAT